MAKAKLSPPWVTFVSELEQLFKLDPEVHIIYDEDEYAVKVYVDTASKAGALERLLPSEKVYGNVALTITVVPANGTAVPVGNIFQVAFKDNGAFSFVKTVKGIFSNDLTYVVFKNEVVQYFNDDLGDIYGNCSTLYQEIAKDVFGQQQGVFFCTDVKKGALDTAFGVPLGEWP